MKNNKLIFGVCGIGRGHIYRQLPIISHFAKTSKVVIFAFGESYIFYKDFFVNNRNVKVFLVVVPWLHGGDVGINYQKTSSEPFNKKNNFISQNFATMEKAYEFFAGKPDLVVSDYEPISAQYSYSLNVPLITIDQQSKYFYDGYPDQLDSLSFVEERARLNLFFPKANTRIACSFFQPPSNKITYSDFKITIMPPVIRNNVAKLKTTEQGLPNQVLVYLSPYSSFVQNASEVLTILAKFPKHTFHLFVSKKSDFAKTKQQLPKNIKIYFHDDGEFFNVLRSVGSAICTAGHMFISEMMFLNKPIYTIPLQTYEQKYNAKIIEDNGFGIARPKIHFTALRDFLVGITKFRHNIMSNKNILLNKEIGQVQIINLIEKMLKS
jgi:uncharacterized protein (TIGR00661 family)